MSNRKTKQTLLFLFAFWFALPVLWSQCPTNNRFYVDADANSGFNDGTSWADAYTDLQDALLEARTNCTNVTEIWVAAGTYKPTASNDRTLSFQMKENLAIYGGFAGTETMLSERNWVTNVTILSGDIGSPGNGDNSYHVIDNSATGLNATAVLDGFTINGGNADGSGSNQNNGGGILNTSSSATIANCYIINNSAAATGGGAYNAIASPTYINCLFAGNTAVNGGGMINVSADAPVLTNCIFLGNSASNSGGGVNCVNSAPILTNCSFSGNSGSALSTNNNFFFPVLNNCIVWGNTSGINGDCNVSYSIVQGGYAGPGAGAGILNLDPAFVSQPPVGLGTAGDLRLQASSCAIDNGLNGLVPSGITTDFDGNDRFFNSGTVDMGAFEFQGSFVSNPPSPSPTTTNNGLNFDGTDDHVSVYTACGTNNLFPGGDAITVEYWFKGTNLQSAVRYQVGGQFIVAGWTGGTTNPPLHILSNDGSTNGIAVGTGFDDGEWHHIAFTWQRNTPNGFKSYLDGALVAERQSSNTPLPAFNTGFFLGCFNGTGEFMNGTLEKVRVWTVARSTAEIQQSAAGMNPASQTGLLHAFDFDHGTAGGDNSGIEVIANTVNPAAPGLLRNFARNGNVSNFVGSMGCQAPSVLYVNAAATGNNTGSSWTNAFTDLQDAFGLANSCLGVNQIWVAAGSYKPTTSTDRNTSFVLINGVDLYGGFDGTESMLSQRDWVANPTILSGDIGTIGDNTDNSHHVVRGDGSITSSTLDGFTISDGFSNFQSTPNSLGGGMLLVGGAPTIANCVIRDNQVQSAGAGIAIRSSASPLIVRCSFLNNSTPDVGGGISTDNSTPTVDNCVFYNNSARDGSAIRNTNSSSTIINCTFSGNSAVTKGTLWFFGSNPVTMTNCIVWGNNTGIFLQNFANPTVTHSIVQGGFVGMGNLDEDPQFIDAGTGNLRLQACSPAIDAGSNAAVPAGTTTDLDGNPRIFDATGANAVDMGAYEFQQTYDFCTQCLTSGNTIFVNASALGSNDGTSWANAFTDLQDALALAGTCSGITEIWVAAGTYKPTSGTDRSISFVLETNVSLYGGFAGTETMLSQRDWVANETILSGDIGAAGNVDNSYHVVFNNNNAPDDVTVILDGFTITGGNANGSGLDGRGGGICNNLGSPTITNCTFLGNSASFGGGIYFTDGFPRVTNCTFSGNAASFGGGGYTGLSGIPIFVNCTFSGNSGGEFHYAAGFPSMTNCIIWGTHNLTSDKSVVTYSIIPGYGGTGNLDVNPLFVDPANGDLRLQSTSCAIDNGLDSAVPAGITTDLDGNDRFYNGGTVDMGAYEFQGNANPQPFPTPPVTSDNGLHFDGTNDFVSIYNVDGNCNLVALTGGDAITIEYWFKGSNLESAVRLQDLSGQWIVAGWGGAPFQHILSNDGGTNGLPVGAAVTDGNWHHVAMTWERNTVNGFRSYLDGQLVAQRNSSDNPLPNISSQWYLGSLFGNSEFMEGTLDEVRIWNVARTQTEIQNGLCGELGLPQTGLLLYYQFNHGIANGSNPGIGTMVNAANPGTFNGILSNFNLSGNTSNWVTGVQPTTVTAPTGELVITNSTCTDCSLSGGSIAIGSVSGSGGTLEYSTDNGANWSSILPSYDQDGPAQTILASVLSANGCRSSSTQVGMTAPGVCNTPMVTPNVTLEITNSICTGCMVGGGSIEIIGISGSSGQTTEYSTDGGTTWSNILPTYNQTGPAQTILASILLANGCRGPIMEVGVTAPGECVTPAAPTGTLSITNSTCTDCVLSGGSITIGTVSGTGGTLEYSTDNGTTWSSDLPVYDQDGPAQTILASVLSANGCRSSSAQVGMTAPGECAPVVANCQNQTVSLGMEGTGSLPASALNSGSTGCSSLSFMVDNAASLNFDCSDTGSNAVLLTVTDVLGNQDTCTSIVSVEDNNPPTALCANPTVNLTSDGTTSVAASFFDGGSSAACGHTSFSATQTDFDCGDVGSTIAVTLTVTAQSNNQMATCTANVTVADPNSFCCAPPEAICTNVTVQLGPNGSIVPLTAAQIGGQSTAECGLQSEMISEQDFFCADIGQNTVTYTITDVNGESDACTATVTVEDKISPTGACLSSTVELGANGAYTLLESDVFDAANSSDNCSISSVSFPGVTYTCDDAGLDFPVMVTIEDPSGNMDDCTAIVTVGVGDELPFPWTANDIGNQGNGSSYAYDPCAGNNPNQGDFTIGTGGYNLIPQNSDNLAFASVPLCGNGGIQARIKDVVGGYAGLMIRESSDPGSKMYAIYSNLTNLLRREIRYTQNGPRNSGLFSAAFPKWLRLVRQGDLIRAFYRNSNGGNWTLFHQVYLPMDNCVEMGLAVFTTDPNGDASAVFGRVNYQSQGGQNLSAPNGIFWEAETPEVIKASVLPNPVRNHFTLQFSKPLPAEGQATLLNEFGQRIAQQPLRAGERELDWDAGALPAGLYFLEVFTEDGYREVLKVVRQ